MQRRPLGETVGNRRLFFGHDGRRTRLAGRAENGFSTFGIPYRAFANDGFQTVERAAR